MNGVTFFEIQADDPERALAFYHDIFGWVFTRQEQAPIPYWDISESGIRGGILQRPAPAHRGGTNAFTCSMMVEDFDKTAAAILEHGGQVAMEKFAVPGRCWQGYFLDTEDNTFGIFEVDEHAK